MTQNEKVQRKRTEELKEGNTQPLVPTQPKNTEYEKTYDGSVQLIIGPMFSGKTTELIRLIKRFTISKKKTIIIKYLDDTRYGDATETVSHEKQKWEHSIPTKELMSTIDKVLEYDVIGIDEGQFFPDLKEFCEVVTEYGKRIIIAALDGTYQRLPFGQITNIIPICESVRKLRAVCMFCGSEAAFSLRTSNEEQVELIGGEDKYCAVCRKCYHDHQDPSRTPQIKVDVRKRLQSERFSENLNRLSFDD